MITKFNIFEQKDTLNSNFWKWFGDSKVMKDGNPIIVYHGTKETFNILYTSVV